MAGTEGSKAAKLSKSQKTGLSSDWSLQLDSMKLKSLVIAHQYGAVNTFPGLVHTARHTMKVVCTRSRFSQLVYWGRSPKVWVMIGVKS